MLVLLAAVATGAVAQEETLLTTIENTGDNASFTSGSKTFDNIATVTFSGEVDNDGDDWGWYSESERTLTVTAAEGYTITRVKFYTDEGSAFDEEAPFEAILVYSDQKGYYAKVNGTSIGQHGVTKIEVYGTAPATVAVTGVTLAPTSATLTLGETETVTLIPTVLPADATDKSVTWSSSNEAVATVADGVVTAVAAGTATITVTTTDGAKTATCAVTVAAPAASTYTVTLKEGTEDATSWTIAPAEATTTGVEAGTEVKATYGGTKKVKSVKAVKKAVAPSFTEVTTFSELQTALSAGKNVKLMNDIVCTAEISITSNGALTIDGNGKKLSTTSEIRAFKVGSSATVAFKDLTLTGFVSGGGPAINNSGTIVLDGCTISNCHVNNSNGGGAIENKSNGKLYAINTTFSGNYSGEIGGAINNYNSSLYMSGCTFTDNYTTKSSAYWGGAIGINGGSEVRLINCAFSGNKYGTNTGTSDIGVYYKPTNYTIAGCTGATIASNDGDITTNTTGTATLDYSDLSNISFTYNAE